jgi:SAM-dependent methyltransferase
MALCTAMAFEAVAADYDRDFGDNPLARRMRERVWQEMFSRLPAPATVLDVGCGTGIDAAELALRGHRVVALDDAPAMLQEVHKKQELFRLGENLKIHRVDLNDPLARRRLFARVDPDAVLANFGVLNCIRDLRGLAKELGELLLPGGLVFAVVMGKLCLWDLLYHGLRFRPRRALARLLPGVVEVPVAGQAVPVRYYRPVRFCRLFAPWFRPLAQLGLGAFLPPPYLADRIAERPGLTRRLEGLEERWGRRWPAPLIADHFLVVLERK